MYGQADKYLSKAEMSPAQQANCRADKLATAALIAAVEASSQHLSVGKSLRRDCRGTGYGVSKKCNHRALGKTGGASTV